MSYLLGQIKFEACIVLKNLHFSDTAKNPNSNVLGEKHNYPRVGDVQAPPLQARTFQALQESFRPVA
jgi:hypothetical protein